MKNLNLLMLFSLAAAMTVVIVFSISAQETEDFCLACHLELDDELLAPAVNFSQDVHNANGISCADCHGGDPAEEDADVAMSAAKGFIGTPSVRDFPEFCGSCHSNPAYMRRYNPSLATDQLEKYWTSHHGQLIKRGDGKVAQCVSCHGVHDIRPSSDPRSAVYAKNVPLTCARCHANAEYMATYKISTDQYEKYETSVHGEALLEKNDTGAPACNDCHGNHAAMPPGISSIGRVCYQCHLAEGELFSQSPHKDAFDDLGVPECAFCHGNHAVHALTDRNMGVSDESICLECHSEGDDGYRAAEAISGAIADLKSRYDQAATLLDEAERKGVEVSDQLFSLREVRQSLINVRKLLHAFDPEKISTSTGEAMALAEEVHQAGIRSIEEVKNRRAGFLVFTAVTLILAFAIYLRLRQRDQA